MGGRSPFGFARTPALWLDRPRRPNAVPMRPSDVAVGDVALVVVGVVLTHRSSGVM